VNFADVLRDEPVRREVRAMVDAGRVLPGARRRRVTPRMVDTVVNDPSGAGRPPMPNTEAVVLEFGRPALLIRDGRFEAPESRELRARLLPARARLEPRLRSVGRIELVNHSGLRWGGTGWLITDTVVATNAHVAKSFVVREDRGYPPIVDAITGQQVGARIDFHEEYQPGDRKPPGLEVPVRRVLFMAPESERAADVALLELEKSESLPEPIPINPADPVDGMDIAVVGYPSRDLGGVTSAEAALETFGEIYDVKRLSPGKVLIVDADDWFYTHDATTLHGSSGSVVLDLEGNAVGLHFSGDLGRANYAVKPAVLLDRLARLRRKAVIVVPGTASPAAAVLEGVSDDYTDRTGYDPAFLGPAARLRVELPAKTRAPRDVLTFGPRGNRSSELKYEHFSVAMSRKRKLCLWSAANVDGERQSAPTRTAWRIDPRIPRDAQTIGGQGPLDVYGEPPRFARGHMTRRKDPMWGPVERARLANADSMHLTNAVPQMQPFNAGIWLGLEDYALEHCVEDEMRICVITGPVLDDEDPERWGVKIPLRFWKVIAFVHDDTKKLTATGYVMSQEDFLAPEEFIYGQYETRQRPIREIEELAGLSFGDLARRDPLRRGPEALAPPLTSFEQIVFV
jgi:endonuclease G